MNTRENIHRGSGNIFADLGGGASGTGLGAGASHGPDRRDVEIIIKPKTKEEKFATTQVLLTTTL